MGKNRRPPLPLSAAPAPTDAERAAFFERRCAALESENASLRQSLALDLQEIEVQKELLGQIVARTNAMAAQAVRKDEAVRRLVKRRAASLSAALPAPLGPPPAFVELTILPNPLWPRKNSPTPPKA